MSLVDLTDGLRLLKRKGRRLMQSAAAFVISRVPAIRLMRDRPRLCRRYRRAYGVAPDLDNPRRFSEKTLWRMLYGYRPEFARLSDKYAVRDVVAEKIGAEHLIPLLAVASRFDDIDFDALPDKFVIKTNHASGQVALVRDKAAMDLRALRRKCEYWLHTNYYFEHGELQYCHIPPKLLVEEMLEEEAGKPPRDFKFYVFDGKVAYFHVDIGRFHDDHTMKYFDRDLNPHAVGRGKPMHAADIDLPPQIGEMIRMADLLGEGFDFVRVDLYAVGGKIYFGELTFCPGVGLNPFNPPEYDAIFGELWALRR